MYVCMYVCTYVCTYIICMYVVYYLAITIAYTKEDPRNTCMITSSFFDVIDSNQATAAIECSHNRRSALMGPLNVYSNI